MSAVMANRRKEIWQMLGARVQCPVDWLNLRYSRGGLHEPKTHLPPTLLSTTRPVVPGVCGFC